MTQPVDDWAIPISGRTNVLDNTIMRPRGLAVAENGFLGHRSDNQY